MVLGEIADLDIMTDLECTHIIQLPHDTFDQRRLSFAVLTHKSYFLSSANGERHVMKHGMLSKIFAQVFYDQGEVAAPGSRWET